MVVGMAIVVAEAVARNRRLYDYLMTPTTSQVYDNRPANVNEPKKSSDGNSFCVSYYRLPQSCTTQPDVPH